MVKLNARKFMSYCRARYRNVDAIEVSAIDHAESAEAIPDRRSKDAEALMASMHSLIMLSP